MPSDFPEDIPVTWDQQVQKANDCYEAGARILHIHVRDPKTGKIRRTSTNTAPRSVDCVKPCPTSEPKSDRARRTVPLNPGRRGHASPPPHRAEGRTAARGQPMARLGTREAGSPTPGQLPAVRAEPSSAVTNLWISA
ncbi:MAG: 3-keto-5-aminohexanoate cleavage protein [Mycobacterium sp.]|uniref:3-keto-5-aminohexanoate cleavage protein n=1 Tax=Mycobacterium sp. TaxID=1785 RepID=UPI003F9A8B50